MGTMPSRETTCLNEVFRLKNVSNFTYDDIFLSSSKSIEMNVLNNHLHVMKGHGLLFFFQVLNAGLLFLFFNSSIGNTVFN